MIECTSCHQVKPKDSFDPHRKQCKDCRREYRRRWQEKNREHVRSYNRNLYHRNEEYRKKQRERGREWYARRKKTCGLYLVEALGKYKIGISADIGFRMGSLYGSMPCDMTLVLYIPMKENAAKALERKLHNKYRHHRVRREWFDLTFDEVGEIMQLPGVVLNTDDVWTPLVVEQV